VNLADDNLNVHSARSFPAFRIEAATCQAFAIALDRLFDLHLRAGEEACSDDGVMIAATAKPR
jgi:hypothetical protein